MVPIEPIKWNDKDGKVRFKKRRAPFTGSVCPAWLSLMSRSRPPHKWKAMGCVDAEGMQQLPWPTYFPDINPTEHRTLDIFHSLSSTFAPVGYVPSTSWISSLVNMSSIKRIFFLMLLVFPAFIFLNYYRKSALQKISLIETHSEEEKKLHEIKITYILWPKRILKKKKSYVKYTLLWPKRILNWKKGYMKKRSCLVGDGMFNGSPNYNEIWLQVFNSDCSRSVLAQYLSHSSSCVYAI